MLRTLLPLLAAFTFAVVVLGAVPAEACGADKAHAACACDHAKKKDAAAKTDDARDILQPVDEILSATCTCTGPADCTCKKGECKCKKCQKHHKGVKKTQLIESLRDTPLTPALPQNARHDATAGVFI